MAFDSSCPHVDQHVAQKQPRHDDTLDDAKRQHTEEDVDVSRVLVNLSSTPVPMGVSTKAESAKAKSVKIPGSGTERAAIAAALGEARRAEAIASGKPEKPLLGGDPRGSVRGEWITDGPARCGFPGCMMFSNHKGIHKVTECSGPRRAAKKSAHVVKLDSRMGKVKAKSGKRRCSQAVAPGPRVADPPTTDATVGEPPLWPVDTIIEALDCRNMWCVAKVLKGRGQGLNHEVYVHYVGWNAKWNEWHLSHGHKLRAKESGVVVGDLRDTMADFRKVCAVLIEMAESMKRMHPELLDKVHDRV